MTRKLLQSAMIELMREMPFREITIKRLCEQADVNRSTFYLHYADQSALLQSIEDDVLEKTFQYLENVGTTAKGPDMLAAFLRYIQDNEETFSMLLRSGEGNPFRRRLFSTVFERIERTFSVNTSPGAQPYVISFLMSGSFEIIIQWMERGFDIPAQRVASLLGCLYERVMTGGFSQSTL